MEHDKLIEQCLKGHRNAQKQLFDLYPGKMYYLCLRYAVDEAEAQDMLQEGFVRLFKNLQSFQGKGSFEGWVRRIFVHTAIKYYHKMRKHNNSQSIETIHENSVGPEALASMSEQEILTLISKLPEGYRIVFNMYAIEGFSHKEIAETLDIQESTSRSQLVKARKLLQSQIMHMQKIAV